MVQRFVPKSIWFFAGAICLCLVPLALWAAMALRIQPAHEREGAFCLGLLEGGGAHVTFADGRAIQLLGERVSYAPEESSVSREGRLAAVDFLAQEPSAESLSHRLRTCRSELGEIIQSYTWHSCGFGVGSLSEEWSLRDQLDFNLLTGEERAQGGLLFSTFRERLSQ